MPLFGLMTRRYGVIPVEREAGAKALRAMVAAGKAGDRDRAAGAHLSGRHARSCRRNAAASTRASPGLYRALGLPVVPVAIDSGRLWGRGLRQRSGIVTFKVGEPIPPGSEARGNRSARPRRDQRARAQLRRRAPSFSAAATMRRGYLGDLCLGEALLVGLKRDFERERQAVGGFEPVEQPDVR